MRRQEDWEHRRFCANSARAFLVRAREWARAGGSPRLLGKIDGAIRSAEGAIRHAKSHAFGGAPPDFDPENIYNSPTVRQSIEEDRPR